MSETLITDQAESQYGSYYTLRNGNVEANISFPTHGGIRVCCKNASHRVWKGSGRHFATYEEALAYYKKPEMKAMIQAAIADATNLPEDVKELAKVVGLDAEGKTLPRLSSEYTAKTCGAGFCDQWDIRFRDAMARATASRCGGYVLEAL